MNTDGHGWGGIRNVRGQGTRHLVAGTLDPLVRSVIDLCLMSFMGDRLHKYRVSSTRGRSQATLLD